MRLASYVLSLCLHAAAFLLVIFWPHSPPLRLDTPPVMISLVDASAAMGGNARPSPILGSMGTQSDAPHGVTAPAPKEEIAAPAKAPDPEPVKVPNPPRETVSPIKKPEPKEVPPVPQKVEKKEEPKKEEPRKEKEPPVKQPVVDPIKAALDQARRKATSRADSGDRGSAIEQALAQAQRKAGGNRGGGGGEGAGPGGGGLGDVYMGQVMLAVRPNWGFASAGRINLSCVTRVKVDMQGNVLQADISQSSGNSQFDASAVNAVRRTSQAGQFPPPPSQEYTNLDIVFTLDELMGR